MTRQTKPSPAPAPPCAKWSRVRHDEWALSADDLHQRGLTASNAGRHSAARKNFEEALSRATDNQTRARIQLSLAYTEAELGTVEAGLALCRHALELSGVSRHVRGLIWSQLGLLHMRAGDGRAALHALNRAATMLESTDHEALAVLEINRGNVHLQRGEPEPAIRAFQISKREYAETGRPLQRDKAVHNLGYAYLLTGDIVRALELMDRAHDSFVALGPVYEAVGSQDRAEALMAAGMPTEAAAELQAAANAFARRRMRKRQAEALLVLARLLVTIDPRESRRVARRAARLFSGNGSTVWALRAEAVALEAQVNGGAKDPDLVPEARRLATLLHRHGIDQDATVLRLQAARLAVRVGDLTGARRALARTAVGDDAPLPNRLLAQEVRAELAAAADDRKAAMRHTREGLAELHGWQATFGSLDLQSSLVGHGRGLARLGLRTAIAGGRPQDVFEWAERARSLVTRVAPVRPTSDPEHVESLRKLRTLIAEDGEHAPAPGELKQLRRHIRESAWQEDGSGIITEPMELEEVQAALGSRDGSLVVHLMTDGQLHALIVTARDAYVVPLGPFAPVEALLGGLRADLDVSAAHLPAPMRGVVRESLRDRLARLAEHLVAPLSSYLDGSRVALVPSGPLLGVPWHLLDGLQGRPMTLPRSASLWLGRTPPSPPSRAALVAGPHVQRAAEEVERASAGWAQAQTLTGSDATTDRVSAVASGVDVLHVAAHGHHSADNPLFAGVELTDGMWFGYDIDALPRCPEIVVLSACELGRSTIRWAEEAVGMPTAWLHAGTHVVIASAASVDDDVACEVLAATHTGLARGQCPADALAEATSALRDLGPSTFTCIGAGW